MATYQFSGYSYSDLNGTPTPGNLIQIDPNWDVDTDVLTFTFTDNDNVFDGDTGAQEVGSDSTQDLVVTDAFGNVLASGQGYLEGFIEFTAPDGHTITGYQVEIAGVPVGAITSEELQPGVSYMVTYYSEVEPNPDATYDLFGDFTYDQDAANTIQGGTYADTLNGGASNDSISAGAGNDVLDGGTGNDTLAGGTGNDILTGGGGDDLFIYNVGDGNDTITDFNSGNSGTLTDGVSTNNDFIDLSGYYDDITELWADQADDGILNQSNDGVNGVDYSDNTQFGTGSLTFTGASGDASFFTAENTNVVCFLAGTLILTTQGEVAVETLAPGDEVITRDHGPQPVRWVGMSRVESTPNLAPVRIRAGALAAGRPTRDLWVSPQHRILVQSRIADRMIGSREVLVAARKLAALPGIAADIRPRKLHYVHLLCDAHEIIFAEGAPSETLWPGPQARQAMGPEAWDELTAIFPGIGESLAYYPPARPIPSNPQQKHLVRRHQRNGVPLIEGIW